MWSRDLHEALRDAGIITQNDLDNLISLTIETGQGTQVKLTLVRHLDRRIVDIIPAMAKAQAGNDAQVHLNLNNFEDHFRTWVRANGGDVQKVIGT